MIYSVIACTLHDFHAVCALGSKIVVRVSLYVSFFADPYNAGPGFFFPGQYPTFNDPTFDMIRQIQAQIEAQHQA